MTEARSVAEKLTELEARKREESKTSKIAIRRKALIRVICVFFFPKRQSDPFWISKLGTTTWQLRTQLTQALEHSALPEEDLLAYITRFQKDITRVIHATL